MGAKLSDIGKIITDALKSNEALEEASKVILESVPKRTRLGNGVKENNGPSHKLPTLKNKTKYNRKILKNKGQLTGPGAQPAKSGLNATGAMLTGMKSKINNGKLEIELADTKQTEKANHVLKINPDFVFMNLSSPELNRVIKAMSKKITEMLKTVKFDKF